jgi:hypothetical protein
MDTPELVLELLRQLQDREIDEFKFVRDESSPMKAEIWVNGEVYVDRRIIDSNVLNVIGTKEEDKEWSKNKTKELQEKRMQRADRNRLLYPH